ncbi:MAG: anthranilate phosphoribosyltransferase [Candidatus Omnitrophica bacterium]|nr:anthranilate phosphoribosyltransferase [Candidatus Omnitrophota bacterium]
MIQDAIEKLIKRENLTTEEMIQVFDEIMSGKATQEEMKKFLISLKEKGESSEEIAAAATIMRRKSTKVRVKGDGLIDTCGTGGASVNDVNISTMAALVLAACGLRVAKHGNRSFTGKCGSADILEALGVNIETTPEKVAGLIDGVGIGFIFAKNFHPAMRNVMGVRRELKTRTIFNILGPLSNPAGANQQILGVYKPELTEVMAGALNRLGTAKAIVAHGMAGLDEISISGETKVSELKDGKVRTYFVKPADFGLNEGSIDQIRGGDVEYNKKVVLDILRGKDKSPRRDMVLMNSAAALKMTGKCSGFEDGVRMAADCIDSGKVMEKLNQLREESNG